jgi:hypothetical protein
MINVTQLIEVIKKQGAVGVLALWLAYTHFEVQDVKARLYNCLEKGEEINRKPLQQTPIERKDTLAVVPDKKRKLAKI